MGDDYEWRCKRCGTDNEWNGNSRTPKCGTCRLTHRIPIDVWEADEPAEPGRSTLTVWGRTGFTPTPPPRKRPATVSLDRLPTSGPYSVAREPEPWPQEWTYDEPTASRSPARANPTALRPSHYYPSASTPSTYEWMVPLAGWVGRHPGKAALIGATLVGTKLALSRPGSYGSAYDSQAFGELWDTARDIATEHPAHVAWAVGGLVALVAVVKLRRTAIRWLDERTVPEPEPEQQAPALPTAPPPQIGAEWVSGGTFGEGIVP